MKKSRFRRALPAFSALLLAACGGGGADSVAVNGAPAIDTKELAPHEVIVNGAEALRANDLQAFLKITLPAGELEEMQAQWAARKSEPVSEADKQQYRQTMNQLTQEGAVDKIMAELEPQLAQMKQQMPMMIGMFSGIAQASVAQAKELTAEQKAQARDVLTAVSEWAMKTDLASPELARQAVEVAVETARQLNLPTIESVRALSFEQMLHKSSMALAGVKEILAVYNLQLNEMLQSIEAETVSREGDKAKVRTQFTFLGTPQTQEIVMVKKNGQWIPEPALKEQTEVAAGQPEEAPES